MNDPVQGFLFTLTGLLVLIKAIAEPALYITGSLAALKYLRHKNPANPKGGL